MKQLNTLFSFLSCPHLAQTERNADEPRVEQTESAPEVAAGADAGEPRVEQAESAPDVAAGADAEEPRVEQTEGDGWHVVGGSGGNIGAHKDEVRPVILLGCDFKSVRHRHGR